MAAMDGFSADGMDPYRVLGLEKGAESTPEEIKKARFCP